MSPAIELKRQKQSNQASFTLPEWSMLQSMAYLPASNRPPLVKEVAVGGGEGPCVCQQDFAPSYALNTLKLLKKTQIVAMKLFSK